MDSYIFGHHIKNEIQIRNFKKAEVIKLRTQLRQDIRNLNIKQAVRNFGEFVKKRVNLFKQNADLLEFMIADFMLASNRYVLLHVPTDPVPCKKFSVITKNAIGKAHMRPDEDFEVKVPGLGGDGMIKANLKPTWVGPDISPDRKFAHGPINVRIAVQTPLFKRTYNIGATTARYSVSANEDFFRTGEYVPMYDKKGKFPFGFRQTDRKYYKRSDDNRYNDVYIPGYGWARVIPLYVPD